MAEATSGSFQLAMVGGKVQQQICFAILRKPLAELRKRDGITLLTHPRLSSCGCGAEDC
jgi:hypothetical protein